MRQDSVDNVHLVPPLSSLGNGANRILFNSFSLPSVALMSTLALQPGQPMQEAGIWHAADKIEKIGLGSQ